MLIIISYLNNLNAMIKRFKIPASVALKAMHREEYFADLLAEKSLLTFVPSIFSYVKATKLAVILLTLISLAKNQTLFTNTYLRIYNRYNQPFPISYMSVSYNQPAPGQELQYLVRPF